MENVMDDLKVGLTQPDAISTDGLERYYAELTNIILTLYNVYNIS